MHRNTSTRHSQRLLSIHSLPGDEQNEEEEEENNDHFIQTQYATPMGQLDKKPAIMTTNQLQLTTTTTTTPPFLLSHQRRGAASAAANIEMIDLTSPMVSPIDPCQSNYVPYTMNMYNEDRLSILPMFPPTTKNEEHNHRSPLLLASLAVNRLSSEELARRQSDKYPCLFSIFNDNAYSTSFLIQQYQTYYVPLIKRLHIATAILDYNYLRLKQFIKLYHQAYLRAIPHAQQFSSSSSSLSHDRCTLDEHEYPQLMEFYLQIDVDLFYMKTCSFRNAQPRSTTEGLFCMTIPDCQYTVQSCHRCSFCTSFHQTTQQLLPIKFNLYQRHRFVNGYESILNCPASCRTTNIIYVLTCQCGKYDFIGETSGNLPTRLLSHRFHTNRQFIELFIGEQNYLKIYGRKTNEMTNKDRMRLYQHPKRCSEAIQMFLNHNTSYWIFVPMINEDANHENIHYPIGESTATTTNLPLDSDIQTCIDALPKSPSGYKFSRRQRMKQYEFFNMSYDQQKANCEPYIYNAAIITVLPTDTSHLFRQLIHSLFVTHTETKLNTLGHLFTTHLNAPLHHGIWCDNLRRHHHPVSSTSS